MSIQYRPTLASIDLQALRHNVGEIKKRIPPGVALMAVVKANAYGHGAVFCARVFKGSGVESLAVATPEEGMELRNAGLRGDIFVLDGLLKGKISHFQEFQLTPVVHCREDLDRLAGELKDKERPLAVHLKIDTGMGRLGFLPQELDDVGQTLRTHRQLAVTGILTHLAQADEENAEPTDRQFLLFEKLRKILPEKGLNAPLYHIANSAAIIDGRLTGFEVARPGIMLYGCYPHPRHREKISLKPVMTFKTEVMSVRKMPKGSPLGYGGTFVTERDSTIAALPVGYADGYPRLVSNRGHVLIKGKKAKVVGRVSMDLTLVDVTDIGEVKTGDEAVLIGAQGSETVVAEEVAAWAETISYEILCGISSRVPRVYTGL
ncbi:MAG: alanine racemase [Deltaproteobacteria bacterium]|nr:alanine racemase [Deltaproteobacteria bacterium]